MKLRLLRWWLGFSALVWGVSFYGVFARWDAAEQALQGLGARPIAYDPMLDYWLRMASGAFGLMGLWYLVLTLWPRKFAAAIPWFGALMVAEGVILLGHGLRLHLPLFPFYGDIAACFVGGGRILLLAGAAQSAGQPGARGANERRSEPV